MKHYQTPVRNALWQAIGKSESGISISDLLALNLANKATVYRFLNQLEQEKQIQIVDGVIIKSEENCDHHLHLKCATCGKVIHMDCSQMNDLVKHIQTSHGFAVDLPSSFLTGLCASCYAKQDKRNSVANSGGKR